MSILIEGCGKHSKKVRLRLEIELTLKARDGSDGDSSHDRQPVDGSDGDSSHDRQPVGVANEFASYENHEDVPGVQRRVPKLARMQGRRFVDNPVDDSEEHEEDGDEHVEDGVDEHATDGEETVEDENNDMDLVSDGEKPESESSRSNTFQVKRRWTQEEDRVLTWAMDKYGDRNWNMIAKYLVGRKVAHCRQRWQNHLRPNIKKDKWSEEEEQIFIRAHRKLGKRWAEIARLIPGRPENTVKNHWHAVKRKIERHPEGLRQPSILEDYVLSVIEKEEEEEEEKLLQLHM